MWYTAACARRSGFKSSDSESAVCAAGSSRMPQTRAFPALTPCCGLGPLSDGATAPAGPGQAAPLAGRIGAQSRRGLRGLGSLRPRARPTVYPGRVSSESTSVPSKAKLERPARPEPGPMGAGLAPFRVALRRFKPHAASGPGRSVALNFPPPAVVPPRPPQNLRRRQYPSDAGPGDSPVPRARAPPPSSGRRPALARRRGLRQAVRVTCISKSGIDYLMII